MDTRAAEAFIHAAPPWFARWRGQSAHVVYGRRLYPFNNWHQFILAARENPYAQIIPGAARESDLVMAVEICAHPALTPAPVKRPGWFRKLQLAFYYRRRARELRAWLRAGQPAEAFLGSELDKFLDYLSDYCAFPQPWADAESRPVSSPIPLYRVFLLKYLFGWDEKKCWACPVGESSWRAVVMFEAQGHDPKLMTQAQREAARALGHPV